MRVSAAPFAGHAIGGPPAAAHVRDAELRGGHPGHVAKADDLQTLVGRAALRLRGADDIYLCPAGSGGPIAIPLKRTARHYAAIGRGKFGKPSSSIYSRWHRWGIRPAMRHYIATLVERHTRYVMIG